MTIKLPAGLLLMLSVRPKFSYFVLDTRRMIQIKVKGTIKNKTNETPQEIIKRNSGIN